LKALILIPIQTTVSYVVESWFGDLVDRIIGKGDASFPASHFKDMLDEG